MVMKQIKQKISSPSKGGFSDIRLRFGILGFMSLGLVFTPFLGMLASYAVVIVLGVFTAVKIREFQQNNPKSLLLHQQQMDKMYHNGVNAKMIATQLEIIDKLQQKKTVECVPTTKVEHAKSSERFAPKLSLAHNS